MWMNFPQDMNSFFLGKTYRIPGIPENEMDWQPWIPAPRILNHRAPNQQLPSRKLYNIAPENGWLEYDPFLLGAGLFSGALAVSFRECNHMSWFIFHHGWRCFVVCSYTPFFLRGTIATMPTAWGAECGIEVWGCTFQKTNRWQWKITIFNRRYIFKWLFFHCHVSFRGCCIPSASFCCFFSNRTKSNGKNPALFSKERHLKSWWVLEYQITGFYFV